MPTVSQNRHLSAEKRAAIKLAARQRVDAVWTCLDILCPDLALEAKNVLAEKVLDLSRGEKRKAPRISTEIPSDILPWRYPTQSVI
jgi:hypothetical protein